MEIRNITRGQLDRAIYHANGLYDNNLAWRTKPELVGKTRQGGERWRVRLTVKASNGKGASRNFQTGRRIAIACWHAHGTLFDYVLSVAPSAKIKAGYQGSTITRNGDSIRGNWQDWERGSLYYPSKASQWCSCAHSVADRGVRNIPMITEPGCYVAGQLGIYGPSELVILAARYGYPDAQIIDIAMRDLASMGPSTEPGISAQESEWLMWDLDAVENWLNDNVIPDGLVGHWWEGEYFVSPYCGKVDDTCADIECYCQTG